MPKKDKISCRTPTPGKSPTNIAKSKFDLLRRAILAVTPKRGDGILFTDLTTLVEGELTPKDLDSVGSLMWYVTTVKLELEFRGEIARVEGSKPQRLKRTIDTTIPAPPRSRSRARRR